MTSQSPRVYLYKITFEEVPYYYYYGVHKEKRYNEYYMGSPATNKWCWNFYTPKKQILQIFEYSDEGWFKANEIEKRIVKSFYNSDKWCLNENCGGVLSLKVLRENGKKVAENHKKNGTGLYALTPEQRSEGGKKSGKIGGKVSGKMQKELGLGIHGLSSEETKNNASKGGKVVSHQMWECTETGFVANAGNLAKYQRARGIDTSKRKRIE